MATSNEQIRDATIRRQIRSIRFGNDLTAQVLALLGSTDQDVVDRVLVTALKLQNEPIGSVRYNREMRRLSRQLITERKSSWKKITPALDSQFNSFAYLEASAMSDSIAKAVPVILDLALPRADRLRRIVSQNPYEGRTLSQWMKKAKDYDHQNILSQVQIGLAQNDTPDAIVRRLVGSRPSGYNDGAFALNRRGMESTVLTLMNGIASASDQAFYDENDDIIKTVLFVATLDARTTIVCASNDGKTFLRDSGPMPPLHFRCRSRRVPYVNADYLVNRPMKPTTERELVQEYARKKNIAGVSSRDALPYGQKTKFDAFARGRIRELVGTVPGKTTYTQFLRGQTAAFQREVLGVERARLFSTGKLTLDKFVNDTGKVIPLDQLQKMYPSAYN